MEAFSEALPPPTFVIKSFRSGELCTSEARLVSICLTTATIHAAKPAMPSVHQNVETAIMPRLRVYTERSDHALTGSAYSGCRARSGRCNQTTVPPISRRAKSQIAAPLKMTLNANRTSIAPAFAPYVELGTP